MNIVLSKKDTDYIRSLVPNNMVSLVNRRMPIGDADVVRQYLEGSSIENATINILLYGSKLAKKVNFYNSLIGGQHR